MNMKSKLLSTVALVAVLEASLPAAETANSRPLTTETDHRYWLQNMVWHHRFTPAEIQDATGWNEVELDRALKKFKISPANRPRRAAKARLLVLPYPGGRHPRIGFLDGAIDPQRETKVSVFTPWLTF